MLLAGMRLQVRMRCAGRRNLYYNFGCDGVKSVVNGRPIHTQWMPFCRVVCEVVELRMFLYYNWVDSDP